MHILFCQFDGYYGNLSLMSYTDVDSFIIKIRVITLIQVMLEPDNGSKCSRVAWIKDVMKRDLTILFFETEG